MPLYSHTSHSLLPSKRKHWFLPQKRFNHGHFSSSLSYAILFLHCCIKLVACERSLWSLTDCLWYLPCIFFVPVRDFWFEDSHDCSSLQRAGFLRNCVLIVASYFYIVHYIHHQQISELLRQSEWKLESSGCMYTRRGKIRFKGLYLSQNASFRCSLVCWTLNMHRMSELLKGSQLSSSGIAGAQASLPASAWENTAQGMCHLLWPDNWHPSEMAWHDLSIKLESV